MGGEYDLSREIFSALCNHSVEVGAGRGIPCEKHSRQTLPE